MASWTNNVAQSTFNATGTVSNVTGYRANERTASTASFNGSGYSVVGIDATKISQAMTAIETYVNNIETTINEINEKANSKQAFVGEGIETAVKNYIYSIKQYARDLTSQLLAFNDKLSDVSVAWTKAVNAQAETISKSNYEGNNTYQSKTNDRGIGWGPEPGTGMAAGIGNAVHGSSAPGSNNI